MGYFSNSDEGSAYQEKYCDHCLHDEHGDCPVWGLQLTYNYDECNNKESFIHRLIPRSDDGLDNEPCRMFVKK